MKIITGMHRSGTSLVTRLFFEAGADLGDPSTFYRPDRWNPDGYYEQPEVHGLNMKLINGPFWKFAYFWLPSTATILRRSDRAAERLAAAARKYDDKVVKETRFCLTLPAWRRHGANFERVLVCLRDPLGVARSLQRRNWISLPRAYRLWCTHYERLLEHVNDLPVWFIYYDAVLHPATRKAEIADAFRFFDLPADDAKLEAVAAACVKPEMNHKGERAVVDDPRAAALWERLLARHAAQRAGAAASSTVSA